jgi:O-antigen/teichoic acid export membrane protein
VSLLAISGPLIGILFGAEFRSATGVLALLLPGVVLLACARVLANSLAARGKVAINFYISVGLLVVNVLATLLLIPPLGLAGAAAASSIAYGMSLGAQLVVHGRVSSQKWWHALLLRPEDLKWLSELTQKFTEKRL